MIKLDYNISMKKIYSFILITILLSPIGRFGDTAKGEQIFFYVPKDEVIVNSYGVIDEDRNLVDVGIYTRDFIQQANYKYMMQLYDIDPDNIQLKIIPNVNVNTLIIDRRPD